MLRQKYNILYAQAPQNLFDKTAGFSDHVLRTAKGARISSYADLTFVNNTTGTMAF